MFKTAAAAMFIVSATFVGMGASNAYPTPSVDDTPIVNVMEDNPNWDCVTMGNRVCGPDNVDDVPAGCYNDNEEMVAPWPCFVMTDDDGNMDVYTVANVRAWSE